MVDIGIMIEGQNGLNWDNWQRIARTVEKVGYSSLFRSDHFTNSKPPDIDALELWVSLTWLADNSSRLEFGSLVTPMSFRHPAHTARMAAAVDDLSGGRMSLGLGAGWQEREHENFGFDLRKPLDRFDRFEEGVHIITQLLHSDEPVFFEGRFFQLNGATILPRPIRPGGPPLIIGGIGEKRTLAVAAQYADEWNALFIPHDEFSRLNVSLDILLRSYGRRPSDVRRSIMTGCIFGKTREEVDKKILKRTNGQSDSAELRKRGFIVGTTGEILEQIELLGEAGAYRVILQWLDLEDMDGLLAMAEGIIK
jgi:F420-dependent oxidoreductase-like protein